MAYRSIAPGEVPQPGDMLRLVIDVYGLEVSLSTVKVGVRLTGKYEYISASYFEGDLILFVRVLPVVPVLEARIGANFIAATLATAAGLVAVTLFVKDIKIQAGPFGFETETKGGMILLLLAGAGLILYKGK